MAVQRNQLHENPLRYVRLPKVPKQMIEIYTADEIDRILSTASQVQKESVLEWDLLITMAITTGMRKSEMLNLVWSDIDFGEMTIEVTPKEDARPRGYQYLLPHDDSSVNVSVPISIIIVIFP